MLATIWAAAESTLLDQLGFSRNSASQPKSARAVLALGRADPRPLLHGLFQECMSSIIETPAIVGFMAQSFA